MKELSDLLKAALREALKTQRRYERYIRSSLQKALTEMRGEMDNYYRKWAKNGRLSIVELEKYSRYKIMESSLMEILNPELSIQVRKIKNYIPDQYIEAYYRTAWGMDNGLGIRNAWPILSKDVITNLYSITDVKNILMKESLTNYTMDARRKIRQALMNGITLGKTFPSMSNDLGKAIKVTREKANLIVRTEGMSALNAGADLAYLKAMEAGVPGELVWSSILDDRTRPDHAAMQGKIKQADGFFNGPGGERAKYPGWEGLSAGQRINCRCIEIFRGTVIDNPVPYENYELWRDKLLGGED